MSKHYYVTTPIYYLSGTPHLGTAYTTIAADVLSRFKRMDGYDVKFLTGTDEHGLKVFQCTAKENMEPQAYCDKEVGKFIDLAKFMNCSFDDFIRTTEERHKIAATALWNKLVEKDQIYLSTYSGWYAVSDEAYYDESEITTNDKGDKVAISSGSKVTWMEEESYFFRLSAWQELLLEYYKNNPDAIMPQSRRNEVLRFIEGGLHDLSVSRTTFSWGIPVPGNDKHVMYVWLDALTNYLSALGYPNTDGDMQNFWPTDLHLVGKDILRFHAVYWPAFLMAADIAPPKRVFAHGWILSGSQKMSKSLGNTLIPEELVGLYGLDQLRYFLMREVSFGQDGSFTHEAMQQRMSHDLANDFGNLAQRVLSFIYKHCDTRLPTIGTLTDADIAMLDAAGPTLLQAVRDRLDQQEFHRALETIWAVIRQANVYVDEQAPWGLRKTDTVRMETVLGVLTEVIRRLALLALPFMPDSCAKLLDQLAIAADQRDYSTLDDQIHIVSGTEIPQPVGVFPRYQAPATEQDA
jgi:methionyl-tRNA synthetase